MRSLDILFLNLHLKIKFYLFPEEVKELSESFSLFFRSCTDIICCLLFVAYIVGMIIVGIIGK